MNYKIQLISFLYLTSLLNYKLIKKHSLFIKYLITFVYVIDMALLYVLLMYKVNYGVIHIYFLLVMGIGFLLSCFYYKRIYKFARMITQKLKK